MESFLISVFGVVATAIQAVLKLWQIILGWAQESLTFWISDNSSDREKFMTWVVDSLFVWLKENLSKLVKISDDALKLAFTVVKQATEELLQAVREAWKTIRPFLFELRMNFQKEASGWVRVITSKIVRLDEASKQPVLVTQEVTEKIGFKDLPADVREAIIRGTEKGREINIKELRDRELLEMVN